MKKTLLIKILSATKGAFVNKGFLSCFLLSALCFLPFTTSAQSDPYFTYPQQGTIKYECPWLLEPGYRGGYYVFTFSDYGAKTRKDDYTTLIKTNEWSHEVNITDLVEGKIITGTKTGTGSQEWEESPYPTSGWSQEERAHIGRVYLMENVVSAGAIADLDRLYRRGTKNVAGVECAFYHCPDGSKMAIWNGIIMYDEDEDGTVRLRALAVTLNVSDGAFTPTFNMPL